MLAEIELELVEKLVDTPRINYVIISRSSALKILKLINILNENEK